VSFYRLLCVYIVLSSTRYLFWIQQSKLVVLRSLSTFLQSALSPCYHASAKCSSNPSTSHIPSWYLAPSFASPEAYKAFDRLLQSASQHSSPSSRCWNIEVEPESGQDNFIQNYILTEGSLGSHWSLQHLSDVVNNTGELAGTESSGPVDLIFVMVRISILRWHICYHIIYLAFSSDTAFNAGIDLLGLGADSVFS
jgi:pre-rRNA-processing protein IPI1